MRVVTTGLQSTEIAQGQAPAGTPRRPAAAVATQQVPARPQPVIRPAATGDKPEASAPFTKIKIKEKPAKRRGFFARLFGR